MSDQLPESTVSLVLKRTAEHLRERSSMPHNDPIWYVGDVSSLPDGVYEVVELRLIRSIEFSVVSDDAI